MKEGEEGPPVTAETLSQDLPDWYMEAECHCGRIVVLSFRRLTLLRSERLPGACAASRVVACRPSGCPTSRMTCPMHLGRGGAFSSCQPAEECCASSSSRIFSGSWCGRGHAPYHLAAPMNG